MLTLLIAIPVGYDIVRAYWLPVELNRAIGGHYALPMASSSQAMNKGLREKKRDWRKKDIEFTYRLRRAGGKTHLRGEAIVGTRFLKYAGVPHLTVSMDRDPIVADVEIPDFKAQKFEFKAPGFGIKLPHLDVQRW